MSVFIPGVGGLSAGDPEEVPNPNAEMALMETMPARALIDSDTRTIAERIFNRLVERAPGWIARDGNLETWLIEEFAAVAAEIRAEALSVPDAIFQTFGEEVLGIPILLPAPALGETRWTAIDDRGYNIPAGTQITIPRTGDELVVFEVLFGTQIEPGREQAEGVQIRAQIPGFYANDLWGDAEPVDPLFWVDSVEITEPTSQGADGQTLAEYLSELIMLLRVIALRPILPWDFAVLALRVPGVARAVAMDGFEPSDGTWGHRRQVTLILTDIYGEPVPAQTQTAVREVLETLREVNWIARAIDADYEVVDVAYHVTAFAEQDPDVVYELCDAALRDALSPANWRLGTTSPAIVAGEVIPAPTDEHGNPIEGWIPGRQTIYINNLVGLLDRQRGVDRVDWVRLQGEAEDLVLPGPTTLPRPGEIEGMVQTQ